MKILGKIIKVLFTIVAIAAVIGVIFMTNSLSEHRGPIKSMRTEVSKATEFPSSETLTLGGVDLHISDIKTESLNPESEEIEKGSDYNVYYTLNITNNSTAEARFVEDGFGFVTSEKYQYKSYPATEGIDYTQTTIKSGESYSFKFRVKTDEPLSDIGFIMPQATNPENKLLYISFE